MILVNGEYVINQAALNEIEMLKYLKSKKSSNTQLSIKD